MTGQMLLKIEEILLLEKPEAVLVYGDTNSTIAGALAAKKLHIKLVHVEAGLRSFNMKMPEEINRIVTDRISDLLLCPTQVAVANLKKEGLDNDQAKIILTGDIMKDSVQYYGKIAKKVSAILENLGLYSNSFVLATLHRQENTDDKEKLKALIYGLERIHKKQRVVLPLHPRTKKMLAEFNIQPNITIIEPVGYLDMLMLLQNCSMVITDSGGLQKEAFFCKKPCIIMRDETEWVELVAHGFAKIVGSESDKIFKAFNEFKELEITFDKMLYGKNVGERIYSEVKSLIDR